MNEEARDALNKFLSIFDKELSAHAVSRYPRTKRDAIMDAYAFAKDNAINKIRKVLPFE